jgi:hypothetical protein
MLSSLPTFTMRSVVVVVAILEYYDRARHNCMWRNSDINVKDKPIVAWKNVQNQKGKGAWVSSISEAKTMLSS